MNDRLTVDTINSDQLDALYERLDRAEEEARQWVEADSADAAAGSYALRAETAEAERDSAYRERAHLAALLASHYPSVIAPALDLDEPGWWIAYLVIGDRQASWHISPRDAGLFAHVERVEPDDRRAQWDGHTTEQKYQHIDALAARLYTESRGLTETPLTAEAVRQMDADTTQPHTGLVVQPYREHGVEKWVFRCWGTDTCDGWLSLDHTSEQSATQARDRHVTEEHPEEAMPTTDKPVCTATIDGPHVLGGGPVRCTREAGHPENHVGPKRGDYGRTLWTDYSAGATPHGASSEEQH